LKIIDLWPTSFFLDFGHIPSPATLDHRQYKGIIN